MLSISLVALLALGAAATLLTAGGQLLPDWRLVSTGAELVKALSDDSVDGAVLRGNVGLSPSDFSGSTSAIVRSRNFTVSGGRSDPVEWPILDFNSEAVEHKLRLSSGAWFTVTQAVLINTRSGPLFQAPGLDLFAPVLPGELDSGCTTVLHNSAIILHACLPPSLQLAAIQGIPTQSPGGGLNKLIPGTGYTSNPANCTNRTDASPMARCWADRGLYISVSTYSYDVSLGVATTVTAGFSGYGVWVRNATFLCESSLAEDCVARLGAIGCFALLTAARRNGTRGGATAVGGGWSSDHLAPGGSGSGALLLGAVLGAALGGFALGAVAVGLARQFTALHRRRHDVSSSSSGGDLQLDAVTAAVCGDKVSASIGKHTASSLGLIATAAADASRGNRAAFAAAAAADAFSSMSSREPINLLRTTCSGGSNRRAGSLVKVPAVPAAAAAAIADDDDGDGVRHQGMPAAVEDGRQRRAPACTTTTSAVAATAADAEQQQQPAGSGSGSGICCSHHPSNPEVLGNNASPPPLGDAPAGQDVAGAAATNPFLTEAKRMAAPVGTAATPGETQQEQQTHAADDRDDEWLGLILAAEVSEPVTPFTPHRSDLVMGVHVQDMPLQLQAQQAAAQQGGPDAAYCTAGSAWPHESEQMQQQAGSAAGSGEVVLAREAAVLRTGDPAGAAGVGATATASEGAAAGLGGAGGDVCETAASHAGGGGGASSSPKADPVAPGFPGGGTQPPAAALLAASAIASSSPADAAPNVSAAAGAAAGAAVQITSVVLGAGAYGRVVEGLYRGQRVAVKLIKDVLIPLGMHHIHYTSSSSGGTTVAGGRADMRQARAFAQEVEILARCRHPNIVQLLAANLTPPRVCLVMERMDCSLAHLLRPHGPGTLGRLLPLPTLLHIATDIARGLAYIHPTVVHRDLKPGNVLINNRESDCPTAKLTDFGLSRLRSTDAATVNPEVGTPTHMAPEVFDTNNFVVTDKVDIYALGVIMWELVTGCVPWAGSSAMEIAAAINIKRARLPLHIITGTETPLATADGRMGFASGAAGRGKGVGGSSGKPGEEWDGRCRCPPRLAALITQCWEHDPRRRPAAAEVVKELVVIRQLVEKQLQRQPRQAPVAGGNLSPAGGLRGPAADTAADARAPQPQQPGTTSTLRSGGMSLVML